MAQPLDDRIAAALKPVARLADCEAVLLDTKAEQERVRTAKAEAEERRADPALTSAQATEADLEVKEAELRLIRLARAEERLAEVIAERKAREAEGARQAEYEAAARETDKLAAELTSRVPELFGELVGLLRRIKANEHRVAAVNQHRPRGASVIKPAEQAARGWKGLGTWPNLMQAERLTDIALPHFDRSGRAWPEADVSASAPAHQANALIARAKQPEKAQYTVQRADIHQGTRNLIHADGIFALGFQPYDCWLFPHQVELARGQGMVVEPIADESASEPDSNEMEKAQ